MKKILAFIVSLGFLVPLTASAACSPVSLGGTGWCNFTANTILLGNGTGALGTTTAGTNGMYLALLNGLPQWVVGTSTPSFTGTGVVEVFNGVTFKEATTSTSVSGALVVRDANQNAFANNFISKVANISSSGTTVLTAASARTQNYTASGAATFQLPDATTLSIGAIFQFNNNSPDSVLSVTNNGGTVLFTVPFGGQGYATAISVSTANGAWDNHFTLPSNVQWGTNLAFIPNNASTTQLSVFQKLYVGGSPTTTIMGNATSTFGAGISIASGCFQMPSGSCIVSSSGGTVMSITGGTGLNGGAITTSGTLSLKSYLGTSTADTANQISVFTSTNATPTTFGGFANFTFNSTTNLFTVINASTTNLTASQSLYVTEGGYTGRVGSAHAVALQTGTTTTWTATSSGPYIASAPLYFNGVVQAAQCGTDQNLLGIDLYINSTHMTYYVASSTAGTHPFSSNNTFSIGNILHLVAGATSTSAATTVTCTVLMTQN